MSRCKRFLWDEKRVDFLIKHYPNMVCKDIAAQLGCSVSSIYHKAAALKLKKSEVFFRTPQSGRLTGTTGKSCRFPKGHQPWNKGKPCPSTGRSRETQFKKGQRSANYKPVGSTRIDTDGYVYQKIEEPNKWRPQHSFNWEKEHGQIPKGHCLFFKDGNKTNTDIGNLELITLADNMRRNSIHNYPEPIVQATQMRAVLNRAINRRTKSE